MRQLDIEVLEKSITPQEQEKHDKWMVFVICMAMISIVAVLYFKVA